MKWRNKARKLVWIIMLSSELNREKGANWHACGEKDNFTPGNETEEGSDRWKYKV